MSTTSAVPSIFDMNNLTALKSAAKKDDPKAIKAAAQQFEAMFMQMVLKSMRDATPREGMFDSEQTRMYEQLLDQQLSQVMSAKGSLGLAALIEKQLGKKDIDPEAFEEGLPLRPHGGKGFPIGDDVQGPLTLPPGTAAPRSYPLPGAATPTSGDGTQAARDFVTRVMPYAEEAARATGVPPSFLIGQAALETGWGRSEPRYADGRPTYNLFGIKAGRGWSGAAVESATTEYIDGMPQKQTERFRAYASYAEAFRDYASLLLTSPRYAAALGTQDPTTFARGLQRGGYATDPAYSDKLVRIIGGQTLRSALTG
jgi:flagellar protein FlgJ